MKFKFIPYIIFTLILSFYSFAVGQWKVFPHSFIKDVASSFERQGLETVDGETVGEKTEFGEIVDISNVELTEVNSLNNFNFEWGRLNVVNIGKVGAAELREEKLWYVNQNAPSLIEYLSLTNVDYSEVKAIFSLSGHRYAYAAYIDGDCASARLVSLLDKHIALQLACLPGIDADMNGAGGGWLKLSDNEILMSTGTPTNSDVGNEINKVAQSENSLWGKILKIKNENGKLAVEVFSKGHRNPQGITKIGSDIIAPEHGPMGGDEINLIVNGGNYGWPIQSLGSEYDLEIINKSYNTSFQTILPLFSFVPSIGISDASSCPTIYIEYYAPNSCVAVASMRAGSIYFLIYNGDKALFTEKIEFGSRIRKLFVQENVIVAITDYEGIIVGKLTKIDREENG